MPDPASLKSLAGLVTKILAKAPALSGWLLRRVFPTQRCKELLQLEMEGATAQFELSIQRPSHALTCPRIRVHNHLPVGVEVDVIRIVVNVASHQFLDAVANTRVNVPSSSSETLFIPEISLTRQQTEWLKNLRQDWVNARMEIYLRCRSGIRAWEESKVMNFNAPIHSPEPEY